MAEPQSIKIGDREFSVGFINPRQAPSYLQRLAKALGPVASTLIKAAGTSDGDAKLGIGIFSAVISEATALDPEALQDLIDEMAKVTSVRGAKLSDVYDVTFMGKIEDIPKWFVFALRLNFGPLVLSVLGDAPAKKTR